MRALVGAPTSQEREFCSCSRPYFGLQAVWGKGGWERSNSKMSKEKSGTLLILHSLQHIKHVLVDFPSKVRVCLWGVEGSGRVIKACTAASFLSGWQPDSNSEGKVWVTRNCWYHWSDFSCSYLLQKIPAWMQDCLSGLYKQADPFLGNNRRHSLVSHENYVRIASRNFFSLLHK